MRKVTFAQVSSRITAAVMFVSWCLSRIVDHVFFVAELTRMTIAMFCWCLVIRQLPTQLQEEELLDEYQKGVNFGRKDTLEKLTQLGAAFKVSPDGSMQAITEQTAAAAAATNKQLAS